MEVNQKKTTIVKSIVPKMTNGKQQKVKDYFLSVVEFESGEMGPVLSMTEKPPYEKGDRVEITKKVNKSGTVFFSVQKVTPFTKEEEKTTQPKTKISYRETQIAIAAMDKAISMRNQEMVKNGELFNLSLENQENIIKKANIIADMITKVEKNVF